MRKILTYTVIACWLVAYIWLVAGCATAKGLTQDGAWLLQRASDNIQTDK